MVDLIDQYFDTPCRLPNLTGWYWDAAPIDGAPVPGFLDRVWLGPYATQAECRADAAAAYAGLDAVQWVTPPAPMAPPPKPRVVCPGCLGDVPPGAGITVCWHLPGSQPVQGGVFCSRACARRILACVLEDDVPAPACQCGGACGCSPVAPYPHTSAMKERG